MQRTNHAYLRSMESTDKYWNRHFYIVSILAALLILDIGIITIRWSKGNWPTLTSISFRQFQSATWSSKQLPYVKERVGYDSFISSLSLLINTHEYRTSPVSQRYQTKFLRDSVSKLVERVWKEEVGPLQVLHLLFDKPELRHIFLFPIIKRRKMVKKENIRMDRRMPGSIICLVSFTLFTALVKYVCGFALPTGLHFTYLSLGFKQNVFHHRAVRGLEGWQAGCRWRSPNDQPIFCPYPYVAQKCVSGITWPIDNKVGRSDAV